MSEWHFSCRKEYNIAWQKESGHLSREEKRALKIFKKIRFKHSVGKSLFERAFFTSKKPFLELKKTLSVEEYRNIHQIFILFKKRFNSFYKNELPFLKIWGKKISIEANNKILTNNIIKILQILFSAPALVKNINVYLLFSSEGYTGGGANIDEKSISLEISRFPIKNINRAIGIVWHEVIHLLFQNHYFYPKLEKILKNRQKIDIIKETAVTSLFPRGVLGVRFFNIKPAKKLHSWTNLKQTKEITTLVEQFVANKKPFDESYIKKMIKILFHRG